MSDQTPDQTNPTPITNGQLARRLCDLSRHHMAEAMRLSDARRVSDAATREVLAQETGKHMGKAEAYATIAEVLLGMREMP